MRWRKRKTWGYLKVIFLRNILYVNHHDNGIPLYESRVTMLSTRFVYALLTVLADLGLTVEARQCPPLGSVLPPPKRPSQHPAAKAAIQGIIQSLEAQTEGFSYSAVSVGVRSIYEDEPFLDFHHTPPDPASKRGAKEVDDSTVYRLGSVSKLFTVLAALKLAENGVLKMDDPVGRWIPELLGRDTDPESDDELDRIEWKDVTVEAVASHLSGIGGDSRLPFFVVAVSGWSNT